MQAKRRGFIQTGAEIVKRETPLGLYKGLGAVLTGIVPKMAIRFTSYEWYKSLLKDHNGNITSGGTFLGTHLGKVRVAYTDLDSWSLCRRNRSSSSRDANGSCQNSFTSPTSLYV